MVRRNTAARVQREHKSGSEGQVAPLATAQQNLHRLLICFEIARDVQLQAWALLAQLEQQARKMARVKGRC